MHLNGGAMQLCNLIFNNDNGAELFLTVVIYLILIERYAHDSLKKYLYSY